MSKYDEYNFIYYSEQNSDKPLRFFINLKLSSLFEILRNLKRKLNKKISSDKGDLKFQQNYFLVMVLLESTVYLSTMEGF